MRNTVSTAAHTVSIMIIVLDMKLSSLAVCCAVNGSALSTISKTPINIARKVAAESFCCGKERKEYLAVC